MAKGNKTVRIYHFCWICNLARFFNFLRRRGTWEVYECESCGNLYETRVG